MLKKTKRLSELEPTAGSDAIATSAASEASLRKRLQESARESEGAGLQSLPWKPVSDSPLAPPVLDLNWLITQPLLPFLLQIVPAHTIFRSLEAHGLEDAVEIVEWLRGSQLQKVLDFEVWLKNPESLAEDISTARLMPWLKVWLDIGPAFAADRLLELEEETLTAVFSKLFEIRTTESIGEDAPDDFWQTPDRRFYLKSNDPDPESFEVLYQIVQALYVRDARLAALVLSYSLMLLRQESLEDARRWRQARFADAGFVAPEEAAATLRPTNPEQIRGQIVQALALEKKRQDVAANDYRAKAVTRVVPAMTEDSELFDAVVGVFQVMDPDEATRHVVRVLGEERVLQITGEDSVTALDFEADPDVALASVEAIVQQCNRLLAFVETAGLRQSATRADGLGLLIEKALGTLSVQNPENANLLKARIARVSNTVASGLSPHDLSSETLARALSVTRGALNLGLQECLLSAPDLGLPVAALTPAQLYEEDEQAVAVAAHVVDVLGPEFIFKLGWNRILALGEQTALRLMELAQANPTQFGFLHAQRAVTFADGTVMHLDLVKLWRLGRYVEVRSWLAEREEKLPAGAYFVLSSLLNRLPLYPELLAPEGSTVQGSVVRHPFCEQSEIAQVQRFLENLPFALAE